jgi:hypothetical protein
MWLSAITETGFVVEAWGFNYQPFDPLLSASGRPGVCETQTSLLCANRAFSFCTDTKAIEIDSRGAKIVSSCEARGETPGVG